MTMEVRGEELESGRVYAGKSAGERVLLQRQQFLEAGLELFGTIGYRASTVRLLCKQAGLIDRYFYRNFATTEDLLEAVYNNSMDLIEAEVVAAVADAPPDADIDSIVKACLEAFFAAIEDRRVARLCWLEVLGVSPRIDSVYSGRVQRFARLLLSLATRLFDTDVPRGAETEYVAIAAVGGISQSAMHWLLSDYKASRRTVVAATAKVIRGLALVLGETLQGKPAVGAAKQRRRRGRMK